jgi:hypothetical protein
MYAPNKTPDLRVHREIGLTWRRKLALLVAASVLLVAGIAAATLYFTYEPTTLTVAVGPAGGENVRIMQALAQQFARERATIRLRVVVSEGGPRSAAAGQGRRSRGHSRRSWNSGVSQVVSSCVTSSSP